MINAPFFVMIKKNPNEQEYRIQTCFPDGKNKWVSSSSKKIDLIRQPESGYALCCYEKDQTENIKNMPNGDAHLKGYKSIPDYEMHKYGFDFRA